MHTKGEFSKIDDSALVAKLSSDQTSEYVGLLAGFKHCFSRVEDIKNKCGEETLKRKEAVPFIANLMAWQQILSTFRSLNG